MSAPGQKARRRLPAWLFVLLLLAAVTLVAGLPYAIAGNSAKKPRLTPVPVSLALPPGTSLADLQEARVIEEVDGDTIDVILDGRRVRVRYYGVDTPEPGERCFREATDRNRTLIGEAKTVRLLADARGDDRFERSLRYVFLPDGTSVDATLVAEGFGFAWRQDGRYRDQIIEYEGQSREARRGCLWEVGFRTQ